MFQPSPNSAFIATTLAFAMLAPVAARADEGDAETQLREVVVTGRTTSAQRTELATSVTGTVRKTPQAIGVVTPELLREQRITTLEQGLRDVPGITVAIGEGGTLAGDQFKIRGIDAANDVYIDGLRDFGVYTRDSFDYQQVQVLKGPSGAMFGRGTTGGAINTLSKQPTPGRDHLDVDATVGTGDYYRATADLNHTLNDTTAVRLNLMANSTGVTGRDRVGSDRWGVAAAVGFGLGTSRSFTLNYLHQEDDRAPGYGVVIGAPAGSLIGLPATEFGVDPKTFQQFTTDRDRTRADVLTGRFRWDASPSLTLQSDTRLGSYDRRFQYTSVDSCAVNPLTKQNCIDALVDGDPATLPYITFGGGGPYDLRAWGFQNITSARASFRVFGLNNEVVLGTDFNHQENRKAFSAYSLPPLSSGVYAPGAITAARNAIAINLLTGGGAPPAGYAPFRPSVTPNVAATGVPLTSITTSAYILSSKGDATDSAGFFTDRLYLTPQVSLIAGFRAEQYDAEFSNLLITGASQTFRTGSFLVSPRFSLVWEPGPDQLYYASYGRSATPVGSGIVGTATPIAAATQAYDPDEGETFEFGAKAGVLGGRLALDAAWFHVNKGNAKQTDPASGEVIAGSSQKQTLQGVELGLTGKLTPDWSVNLAYTYIDSEVRQALACTTATATVAVRCFPNLVLTGRPVVQVPENSAFVWSSYRLRAIRPGLSVAGGFTYQDGFAVGYTTAGTAPALTLTREARIPATFSLDGLLQYETRRWRAAVNLYNLTDRLNYAQSFSNRGAPAQGRTFLFTVGYSF